MRSKRVLRGIRRSEHGAHDQLARFKGTVRKGVAYIHSNMAHHSRVVGKPNIIVVVLEVLAIVQEAVRRPRLVVNDESALDIDLDSPRMRNCALNVGGGDLGGLVRTLLRSRHLRWCDSGACFRAGLAAEADKSRGRLARRRGDRTVSRLHGDLEG